MTPTEISDLLDAHDRRRPVTVPAKSSKAPKSIVIWLGITGGVITVLGGFWMFGDGLFATDAEAAAETAVRVAAESKIEKAHSVDMRDVADITHALDTDIEVMETDIESLRASQKQDRTNSREARARIERRLDRHEQRGH